MTAIEPSVDRLAMRDPVTRIEPPQGWSPVDFSELWRHRNLLFYLVLRDLRVIVSRTRLGILWIFIPPLVTAGLMTVVLGVLARVPSEAVPYALIVLSGIVPWIYFSNTVSRATSSMTANAYLLTKVYFPRIIIPIVPLLAELATLIALFFVLIGGLIIFDAAIEPSFIGIVGALALIILLSFGASLWFSGLNVIYPDVGNLVPILLQALAYASPIYYPHALIPAKWHWAYDLNPIVGIVEIFRWGLFSLGDFPVYAATVSALSACVLVATGIFFFRRIEDQAADIV